MNRETREQLIRLSADDLAFVLSHARSEAILVDPDFLPLVEEVRDRLPALRHVIVFGASLPATSISGPSS